MSKIDDGGPAFPYDVQRNGRGHHDGMTLRDWFAGRALAALITDLPGEGDPGSFAEEAYEYADAMLAERAKAKAK